MRPRQLPGERYWEFWDLIPDDDAQVMRDTLIGWGAVRHDAGVYSYRTGTFPQFERKGYRHRVRKLLCLEAFRDTACQAVGYTALLSNPIQVERLIREARDGIWGRHTGIIWYPPPGVMYFTMTREEFETRILRPDEKG
jgi:hypothetical protein